MGLRDDVISEQKIGGPFGEEPRRRGGTVTVDTIIWDSICDGQRKRAQQVGHARTIANGILMALYDHVGDREFLISETKRLCEVLE